MEAGEVVWRDEVFSGEDDKAEKALEDDADAVLVGSVDEKRE